MFRTCTAAFEQRNATLGLQSCLQQRGVAQPEPQGLTRHLAVLTIRQADERGHATKLVLRPGLPACSSVVDAGEVDEINILQATMRAMERALAGVPGIPPDAVLVDGNRVPEGVAARHRECIIKGDSKCFSIAAASVLAKARPTLAPFLFGAVAFDIAWCGVAALNQDRLLWACSPRKLRVVAVGGSGCLSRCGGSYARARFYQQKSS